MPYEQRSITWKQALLLEDTRVAEGRPPPPTLRGTECI